MAFPSLNTAYDVDMEDLEFSLLAKGLEKSVSIDATHNAFSRIKQVSDRLKRLASRTALCPQLGRFDGTNSGATNALQILRSISKSDGGGQDHNQEALQTISELASSFFAGKCLAGTIPFHVPDLLPAVMQTLTEALNSGQEVTAREALELLIELAEWKPKFLRRQLVDMVGASSSHDKMREFLNDPLHFDLDCLGALGDRYCYCNRVVLWAASFELLVSHSPRDLAEFDADNNLVHIINL